MENTGDVTAATGGGPYSFAHGISAASFSFHGAAGDVSVMSNGNITGDTAAIYARSQGSTANGDIAITVLGGTVSGGTTGVGVEILDGADNSLINRGTITSLSGTAIMASTGNEIIDNDGIVTGSVLLGTGLNAFNNLSGGLFNSGADVFLGGGNLLTNSGKLAPAGIGTIGTTALTGDLRQTGSGGFDVDVDMTTNSADLLTASGTADLSGKVEPNILKLQLQSDPVTILSAAGGIVKNGISVQDTAVVDYTLLFPNSTDMQLAISVDFAPEGLNRNETAIAEHLNSAVSAGGSTSLNPVLFALAGLPSMGSLANALDQLSPEVYLDTEIASLFSNLAFTNSMMTCPERDGAYAFIREGQCVWARVSGRFYDQDTTFQTLGFNETNFQVSGGGQVALGGAWRLGGALGYEHSELETSTNAQSDGDRFNGGGVLTYNPGALLLSGAVSGGRGSYDIDRPIAFPGFSALAKGDTDIDNLDGRLRAAYLFDFGGWYLKPLVDLDATRLDLDGTKEGGAGGASLVVKGNDQTYLSASPALELGTQFAMANGTLIRPYVRGGATIFDETDFALKASFAGTPKGVAPFLIRTGIDDVVADVSAGVEVLDVRGASVKLFYDGRFGDTIQENAAGAKATVPFCNSSPHVRFGS